MSRQVLTLLAKIHFVKSPLSRRFLVLLSASMSLALMGATSAFAAGEKNPTGVTGSFNGEIGEGVDPSTGNVKRVVEDINVAGAVGAYPLKFSRTQNSRSGNPLGPFGPGGWWHSYQWGLWLRQVNVGGTTCHPPQPDPPYEGSEGQLFFPDGRIIQLTAETGRLSGSSTSTEICAALGSRAPRQRRGRNGLIGVSANSGASIGRMGPCAERL